MENLQTMMRAVERFGCPVCGMTFEHEDGDVVAEQVLEHVSANHPEWGTKKPKGQSSIPKVPKDRRSGFFRRGRS
jgi:hypothetical protein